MVAAEANERCWVLARMSQAHAAFWEAEIEARAYVHSCRDSLKIQRFQAAEFLAAHNGSIEQGVVPLLWISTAFKSSAINLLHQCSLVKYVMDVWAIAPREELETLRKDFKARSGDSHASECVPGTTRFKYVVDFCNIPHSFKDRLSLIEQLDEHVLALQGIVDLQTPDERINLLVLPPAVQTHGWCRHTPSSEFEHRVASQGVMVLGRVLCRRSLHALPDLHLSRRKYTGPTTMSSEMSLLMCNLAALQPQSLVLDPLCGSCGILLAASYIGASTFGTDVDIRILKGERSDLHAPHANVFSNFEQLQLEEPYSIIRMDLNRPCLNMHTVAGFFDAIVADPPYGLRAGGRKTRSKGSDGYQWNTKRNNPYEEHFPSTGPYSLAECVEDILKLASVAVREGGRLVLFLPGAPELMASEYMPLAKDFSIENVCEERLSLHKSRYLMVAEKHTDTRDQGDCDSHDAIQHKIEMLLCNAKFDMRVLS